MPFNINKIRPIVSFVLPVVVVIAFISISLTKTYLKNKEETKQRERMEVIQYLFEGGSGEKRKNV